MNSTILLQEHVAREERLFRRWVIITAVSIGIVFTGLFFLQVRQTHILYEVQHEHATLNTYVNQQQEFLETKKQLVHKQEQLRKKLDHIISTKQFPDLIVSFIAQALPEGAKLNEFLFVAHRNIVLKGYARSCEDVSVMVRSLMKVGMFETVFLKQVNRDEKSGHFLYEIDMR